MPLKRIFGLLLLSLLKVTPARALACCVNMRATTLKIRLSSVHCCLLSALYDVLTLCISMEADDALSK